MTEIQLFASMYYMNNLSVHPEIATKQLLGVLPKRMRDILELRFGLGKGSERMTLEAIGDKYHITRERVRQIEADAMSRIRKSPTMSELHGVFADFENYFSNAGGVVRETYVLQNLAPHPKHENHVYFLLALNKSLTRFHENDEIYSRWAHKKESDVEAQKTITHATNEIRKIGKPISEPQLFDVLSASARAALGASPTQAVLANWVGLSKIMAKNYFGEWGLTEFPSIKPRGVRDLSYLVMSKSTDPMHFSEVAKRIGELVGKKIHVQTVHNELIKDNRFVLVGRGLYALRECGYEEGTVKDIISKILKSSGPLSKEKIVQLVSAKRFVKPNTIAVNLDNRKYFKKSENEEYTIR